AGAWPARSSGRGSSPFPSRPSSPPRSGPPPPSSSPAWDERAALPRRPAGGVSGALAALPVRMAPGPLALADRPRGRAASRRPALVDPPAPAGGGPRQSAAQPRRGAVAGGAPRSGPPVLPAHRHEPDRSVSLLPASYPGHALAGPGGRR